MDSDFRIIPSDPHYEISSSGMVRAIQRLIVYKSGHKHFHKGGTLKQRKDKDGYLIVGFYRRRKYVHRLVLEAFVGPCPPGMVACHNNGDKTDNRVENLRWDTHKSNMADRDRHGNTVRGEKHNRYKWPKELIEYVRNSTNTAAALERETGVSASYIVDLRTRRQNLRAHG